MLPLRCLPYFCFDNEIEKSCQRLSGQHFLGHCHQDYFYLFYLPRFILCLKVAFSVRKMLDFHLRQYSNPQMFLMFWVMPLKQYHKIYTQMPGTFCDLIFIKLGLNTLFK